MGKRSYQSARMPGGQGIQFLCQDAPWARNLLLCEDTTLGQGEWNRLPVKIQQPAASKGMSSTKLSSQKPEMK